jgi:hypothetical protein
VVSGVGTDGVVAFSRDMSSRFTVSTRGEHSDIAIGPTGNDVYVSVDYASSGGDVYMLDLDTRVRTNLFPTYLSRTATALHFSGKAFAKPGWVVVSSYAAYNADDAPLVLQWLHEKVFLVELKADPRLLMLAHTRRVSPNGWNVGDASYWAEPHATASRDLTRVLFNSNWSQPANRIEAYQIILPSTAIP